MTRPSLKNALHGVFGVYKPQGWRSREAVNVVMDTLSLQLAQRLFQRHQPVLKRKEKIKIGHGGTLVKSRWSIGQERSCAYSFLGSFSGRRTA